MKSNMKHNFADVPVVSAPRSTFNRSAGLKTTMDAGWLVPIFAEEALPGDTFKVRPAVFARMATPIYPIMDNMFFDIHFFSVPLRQIWEAFRAFCGEDSIIHGQSEGQVAPMVNAPSGTGYGIQTLEDYLGLPTGIPDYEHSPV